MLKATLIALSILSLSAMRPAMADCYSDGVRVGTVQKFSQKGLVNKSWEGELVMEGTKLRSTSQGGVKGGNVWAFSVLDPNVAKVIDAATMNGSSVALKYCQVLMGMPETDTGYRITQAVERK